MAKSKKIIGSTFSIWRKHPIIATCIYATSNIYYAFLMVFALIKCFGTEAAKAKASGKKLVTITIIASTVVSVLSMVAGYAEYRETLKARLYNENE